MATPRRQRIHREKTAVTESGHRFPRGCHGKFFPETTA